MRLTLSAFAPIRRHFTDNVRLQKFPAPRFLSMSQPQPQSDSQSDSQAPSASHEEVNAERPGYLKPSEQRRVYILGVGNVGTFVGHALAGIPQRPKVTLMMHNPKLFHNFRDNGRRLIVQRDKLSEHKSGFDVNWQQDPDVWYTATRMKDGGHYVHSIDESPINHLILTVKSMNVTAALKSVRHRLSPHSTIVFMHNGMGVIEAVNKDVFPDPETRPSYIGGIVSHGLFRHKNFNVVHKGLGIITLGPMFTNPQAAQLSNDESDVNTYNINPEPSIPYTKPDEPLAPSTDYLLRLFARTPTITPFITNKTDLFLIQFEKLVINALINPLSVINDCTNGNLLDNEALKRVQRLLLFEICAVISALPEIQGVPGLRNRFAPERMLGLATQVMEKTAANASSMLQDAAAGRMTEIDYINGYIVKRGEELGITCALNYMLIQMVKGKAEIMERNLAGQIPLELDLPTI